MAASRGRWTTVALAALTSMNLAMAGLWLGGGAAVAEPPGCPVLVGQLAEARAQLAERDRILASLPLRAPLTDYAVGSGFGPRLDPFDGRRTMHDGVDLDAPRGSPVRATAPGRVVGAGWAGGYGRMVEIDHGNGLHTRYGHLSAIAVHAGQRVTAGQMVGRLGSSGRSTGPHLHYEVIVHGKAKNPALFFRGGNGRRGHKVMARLIHGER